MRMLEAKGPLYTTKEAARILNVTRGRIHQLIAEGRITFIRPGYELLIPDSEIKRYQRERRKYRKRERS